MIVKCSSPTCSRRIVVGSLVVPLETVLRQYGWRLEQQDGDDADTAYCSRCKT